MTPTPHDALFKATFSQPEHAAAALREVVPDAVAARIDFASLTLPSSSFIDHRLAATQSNLLFFARLAGTRWSGRCVARPAVGLRSRACGGIS
ncbi:Rpn family recombination-promoting nuclease/putative transposase [Sorangium sp. So ce1099]|uniref:Rpn family recombination-promoting nuclease/putative transposase n=1 Tax=Sorangium sp. So ce1099 TaxID=3133331 RepID=UPI003F6355F5